MKQKDANRVIKACVSGFKRYLIHIGHAIVESYNDDGTLNIQYIAHKTSFKTDKFRYRISFERIVQFIPLILYDDLHAAKIQKFRGVEIHYYPNKKKNTAVFKVVFDMDIVSYDDPKKAKDFIHFKHSNITVRK